MATVTRVSEGALRADSPEVTFCATNTCAHEDSCFKRRQRARRRKRAQGWTHRVAEFAEALRKALYASSDLVKADPLLPPVALAHVHPLRGRRRHHALPLGALSAWLSPLAPCSAPLLLPRSPASALLFKLSRFKRLNVVLNCACQRLGFPSFT